MNLEDYVGNIYQCRLNKGQLLNTETLRTVIKTEDHLLFTQLMGLYDSFFLCEFEIDDLIVSGITPYILNVDLTGMVAMNMRLSYNIPERYNDLEDRYPFNYSEKLYYSDAFIQIDDVIRFKDKDELKTTFLIKDLVILDE